MQIETVSSFRRPSLRNIAYNESFPWPRLLLLSAHPRSRKGEAGRWCVLLTFIFRAHAAAAAAGHGLCINIHTAATDQLSDLFFNDSVDDEWGRERVSGSYLYTCVCVNLEHTVYIYFVCMYIYSQN